MVDTTEGKLFTVVAIAFDVAVVLFTVAALKLVVITTVITSLLRTLFNVTVGPVPAFTPFFFH